jgi:flavoprotein
MAQQELRTKVETYRVDKKCENCKKGIMYATGRGITQWHSYWEHKCDGCGHIESYENISYPYMEYVDVKNKKIK